MKVAGFKFKLLVLTDSMKTTRIEQMIQPDWIYGLLGGLMIGCAASIFLLFNGRIMGASGILGGLIDGSGKDNRMERLVFIAGLVIVPGLIAAMTGGAETNLTSNYLVVVAAGLLVGIGTRIGGGCTSGHGICGISRLSMRSILATVFYLLAGGVTMLIFRQVWGII